MPRPLVTSMEAILDELLRQGEIFIAFATEDAARAFRTKLSQAKFRRADYGRLRIKTKLILDGEIVNLHCRVVNMGEQVEHLGITGVEDL